MHLLLAITIIITIAAAYRAKIWRSADAAIRYQYAAFCCEATILDIGLMVDEQSFRPLAAITLSYERMEDGQEPCTAQSILKIPLNNLTRRYEVGEVLTVYFSNPHERIILEDQWISIQRDGAQYFIVAAMGICTALYIMMLLMLR